eukprot:jgi/Botrbrau1/17579/Bobra.0166s0021.1
MRAQGGRGRAEFRVTGLGGQCTSQTTRAPPRECHRPPGKKGGRETGKQFFQDLGRVWEGRACFLPAVGQVRQDFRLECESGGGWIWIYVDIHMDATA